MYRNLIALSILSLLFCQKGFSQENWKPGYIILTKGDTIYGQIQNRDSKSNAQKCVFKISEDQKTKDYHPEDLIGYRINGGKYFVSRSVPMINEGNPLFFEFLIKGKVKVYHVMELSSRYFIEKDGDIHELLNSEIKIKSDGKTYTKSKKEYIGILNYLFSDASVDLKVETKNLDTKSIIEVSKKYHENVCPNELCTIYEMPEFKLETSFGVFAGVFRNTLDFGYVESGIGSGIILGTRLMIENPFLWSERISISADLTLSSYRRYELRSNELHRSITYNGVNYRVYKNGPDTTLNVNLKTYALKIPVSIQYNLGNKRISPYIGAGLLNVFIIKQNKDFVYHLYEERFGHSIPIYHVGFQGKLGAKYKLKNGGSAFIEMHYEISENLDANEFLRLKNTSLSFVAGYYF